METKEFFRDLLNTLIAVGSIGLVALLLLYIITKLQCAI